MVPPTSCFQPRQGRQHGRSATNHLGTRFNRNALYVIGDKETVNEDSPARAYQVAYGGSRFSTAVFLSVTYLGSPLSYGG
jgi:hypothetical protein